MMITGRLRHRLTPYESELFKELIGIENSQKVLVKKFPAKTSLKNFEQAVKLTTNAVSKWNQVHRNEAQCRIRTPEKTIIIGFKEGLQAV